MDRKTDVVDTPYFNRDLSWLDFNGRVQQEAKNPQNPLFEKLNYLSIVSSNLDEFFRIRVGGLQSKIRMGYARPDVKSGLSPRQILEEISLKNHRQVEEQYECYHQLMDEIGTQGIRLADPFTGSDLLQKAVNTVFREEIAPALSPFGIDAYRPFPNISDGVLHVYLSMEKEGRTFVAIVPLPSLLPRIVDVPVDGKTERVLLEDCVLFCLDQLFSGYTIRESLVFRVNRDADLEVWEEQIEDMLEMMEEYIVQRKKGKASRIEVALNHRSDKQLGYVHYLLHELELRETDVYFIDGPLDLTFLPKLTDPYRQTIPTGFFEPFQGIEQEMLTGPALFEQIDEADYFFHHPYDSFQPVVRFIEEAAKDPATIAIKQTLYRVSKNSPIVAALKYAAEHGKQVTVLVELKARFDEENNLHWAKELEEAGCYVLYGVSQVKTHSKVTLVIKQNKHGLKKYAHLGTGNYNESTARFYTDMGILTSNQAIVDDVSQFFQFISGYTQEPAYQAILTSPYRIREELERLIAAEIVHHEAKGAGHIMIKVNSLTDKALIDQLYEASQKGVKVDLLVRGASCLRPRVQKISENIRVFSIVGRFLEHSRIYYFHHDGQELCYLSSADLMTRNMENRIEIAFPIYQADIKERVLKIIQEYCRSDIQHYELLEDGQYQKLPLEASGVDIQQRFMELALTRKAEKLVEMNQVGRRSASGMKHWLRTKLFERFTKESENG